MAGFALKRPCPKCPFRTDVPPYLHRERAAEIGKALEQGCEFSCHQTTTYDEETDDMVSTSESQFCAGALIMLEKQGHPNQLMRIGERLGMYQPAALDMDAPVVEDVQEFVYHHGELDEDDQPEPCGIADPGCESPAGYMVGGSVVHETDGGPTTECPDCGTYVCASCTCYCKQEDER